MQTKENIIINANYEYRDISKTIASKDLADDLHQYLIEILIKTKEDFLLKINKDGNLRYWLFAIAYRSYNSKTGQFYCQYRTVRNYDVSIINAEYNYDIDHKYSIINKIISDYEKESDGNWYDVMLFNISMRQGSGRKAAMITGIPYVSVKKTLKNFKLEIRKRYEDTIKRK